jgi:Protein of unknown function (DUF4054)
MGISLCTPTVITPGIVTFDPVAFAAAFPAFATVPGAALTANFNLATLQLENDCCSAVCDAPTRASLLNLITAHITALLNGVNGQPPQGVVGRISQAQQGSVSVQTEFESESEAAAYYAQTPWGLQYWQSTLRWRTAHYIPAHHHWDSGEAAWDAWPQ